MEPCCLLHLLPTCFSPFYVRVWLGIIYHHSSSLINYFTQKKLNDPTIYKIYKDFEFGFDIGTRFKRLMNPIQSIRFELGYEFIWVELGSEKRINKCFTN